VGTEGNNPLSGIYTEYDGETALNKTIVMATDGLWDNYPEQKIQEDVVKNEGNLMKMA
jgi:serine/threonine protein phosphatase PrpC